ncbi:polysaccharide biosynthesis tyrosine autokinase [Anaerobium acetethylicum]|uniref:non-specific protein-tyrosine kinase n=1 Tax=Anaerobium acetethylicum TaxID=1619234 RepID=A0A1D3TRD1_9FIRM|nr:polysaccharide biosynthesis tyrosine autokinase [Anaerobium acetethylicum]SCP96278.1 capsular exopolysaccharide family [Anaerobium acetethylicum]
MQNVKIDIDRKMDYLSNEAYKGLRTNILFCGSDIKVIAITSCTPNEGKTEISFRLAVSMAEAGKKVMFIDADLRKSVLVGRYKVETSLKGLSHYLSGQESLDSIICTTSAENMQVIFSGQVPPNPAELLGNSRYQSMIAEFREMYDYIIIDTPPLGRVIDAAVIAGQSDGAVLVIESNAISYKFAQKIVEQLEKSNCRILGAVLNKVEHKDKGIYGKYYGKYYGQY